MELFTDAHFWVGVAFVIFVLIMLKVGVHKLAWNALGESGAKIQAQLDEATRLREEAQGLLDQIKVEREQAEKAGEGRAAEDAELEFFLQYGLTGEGQETDEKAHGEY